MSTLASQYTAKRLLTEEGKRRFAYNDRTGKRVTCVTSDLTTTGNLSIGVGINLEVGLDDTEIAFLLQHRLDQREAELLALDWYRACDAVRASVYLDVAFNAGFQGELHKFPQCIEYAKAKDWVHSAAELKVANESLDTSRYAPLRKILSSGQL